jgi:hypothetical protein
VNTRRGCCTEQGAKAGRVPAGHLVRQVPKALHIPRNYLTLKRAPARASTRRYLSARDHHLPHPPRVLLRRCPSSSASRSSTRVSRRCSTRGRCVCAAPRPARAPRAELFSLRALQGAGGSEEHAAIADADALLVLAGDPAAEDEPVRKGTAFQVRWARQCA